MTRTRPSRERRRPSSEPRPRAFSLGRLPPRTRNSGGSSKLSAETIDRIIKEWVGREQLPSDYVEHAAERRNEGYRLINVERAAEGRNEGFPTAGASAPSPCQPSCLPDQAAPRLICLLPHPRRVTLLETQTGVISAALARRLSPRSVAGRSVAFRRGLGLPSRSKSSSVPPCLSNPVLGISRRAAKHLEEPAFG